MKFDYCSDLHLEFWEHPLTGLTLTAKDILKNQQSDNLIIAGDLCIINPRSEDHQRYLDIIGSFYDYVMTKYSSVYFVLGNHDHWGCTFDKASEMYQELMPKVHVLSTNNKFFIENEDCVIVGDTLWSDLSEDHSLQYDMNDYRYIAIEDKKAISWKDTTSHFDDAKNRIFDVVDKIPNKNIIVITHHCPSFKSTDSKQEYIAPAYATNLEYQIKQYPNIKYWIHGHVHEPQDYMIGDTHILCNPRGYYGIQGCSEEFQLNSFEI